MSQKQYAEQAVQPHPSSEGCEQTADSTRLPSYMSTPHRTIGALNSDAINYIYDSDVNPAYTADAIAYLNTRRLSLLFTTLSLLSRPKLPGDLITWKRSTIEWSIERLLGRVRNDFSLRRSMLGKQPRRMAERGSVKMEPPGTRKTELKMQKRLNQRPQQTLRMTVVRRRFQKAVDSDDRRNSKARVFGRRNRGESEVGKRPWKEGITGNRIIVLCGMVYLKPENEEEAVRMVQNVVKGTAQRYPRKVLRHDSPSADKSYDSRYGSVCKNATTHETISPHIIGVACARMYHCDSKLLTDLEADTQREI